MGRGGLCIALVRVVQGRSRPPLSDSLSRCMTVCVHVHVHCCVWTVGWMVVYVCVCVCVCMYACACVYLQVGRLDLEAFREIVGPSHVVTEGSALEAANGTVGTVRLVARRTSASVRMEILGQLLLQLWVWGRCMWMVTQEARFFLFLALLLSL